MFHFELDLFMVTVSSPWLLYLKTLLIYIPRQEWEPTEDGAISSGRKTDDINVRELIHMIEYDGKPKLSTKSDDAPYIANASDKVNNNFSTKIFFAK